MRCTSPRTVGFYADGKTLCWSPRRYSKEFPTFQIPCSKCLSCRLENARQTAVRCMHEAQMHEKNSFITLTYSEENLASTKLRYIDFQLFQKRLRDKIYQDYLKSFGRENWNLLSKGEKKEHYDKIKIGLFVAGEYGDRKKRPHWHALIFNWRPTDLKHKYTSERGDKVYTSKTLEELWGHGIAEIGEVTFQSAGYCARYAAKKLSHGKDGTHDFEPISKRSSKNAIGKKWIEKYWRDVFSHGQLILKLPDKPPIKCGIPRYYEKWFKKTHPEEWVRYVTTVRNEIIKNAIEKEAKADLKDRKQKFRDSAVSGLQLKRSQVRDQILKQKFKKLQENQKL